MEGSADATEVGRLKERLAALGQATHSFAEATDDYGVLLDTIAGVLSEVIGDACALFVLSEDRETLALDTLRCEDGDFVRRCRAVLAEPLTVAARPAWERVLVTGESLLVPKIDLHVYAADSAQKYVELIRQTGLHSSLVVALRLHRKSIGLLALSRFRKESRPYDEADRELAQMIASHAALAIGAARAYAAERAARAGEAKAAADLQLETRNQEVRFRALIENCADGIALSTAAGIVEYLSPAATKMLGRPAADVLGTDIRGYFHAEDVAGAADHRQRLLGQRGYTAPAIRRVVRPDGTTRWIEVLATNLLDNPAVHAVVSNVRDITDRKLAEDARIVAERRFTALFDSGIIGIIIASSSGAVRQANDAFLSMLGYTREDLDAGRLDWRKLTPPEWAASNAETGDELRRDGRARPREKEYFRKDGTRVPVLVGVAGVEVDHAISLSVDLSERKRAEAALAGLEAQFRQAQKMEAVGRLAGGVAHDFNNVLSVILSYGEIMLQELKADDPMRGDVREIIEAGNRAAALTRQLLMFSRQQVLEPTIIDMNDVLAGVEKMLRRLVGEDVDLALTQAATVGKVRADPGSIEQVIMNLVVNARDAMPVGGKLTIETANVTLDEQYARAHLGVQPGPYVLLAVSDTGTGMDEATQARIFEPFFTTKERGKGTGLGLSTVFGIVQASGGSVWVYSEVGKGTTFKVYLPLVEGAADQPRPTLVPTTLRGTETVLLVEDEAQVRALAQGILQRQGYRVIAAADAAEALVLCERHTGALDLLVSDVVMPGMSGPELAKRLTAMRPRMKVLCMSGYTDDAVVRHGALGAGIAFVQKPFTLDSLARKVREVLDSPCPSGS